MICFGLNDLFSYTKLFFATYPFIDISEQSLECLISLRKDVYSAFLDSKMFFSGDIENYDVVHMNSKILVLNRSRIEFLYILK